MTFYEKLIAALDDAYKDITIESRMHAVLGIEVTLHPEAFHAFRATMPSDVHMHGRIEVDTGRVAFTLYARPYTFVKGDGR